MKKKIVLTLALGFLFLNSCSHNEHKKRRHPHVPSQDLARIHITPEGIHRLTGSWPKASQRAIRMTMDQYGLPNSANSMSLVWENTVPFKRTIIYREEVTHFFPVKHTDVLQQFVDYKVPASKVDDLWKFDGSVILDRTKGEMSARCDKEEMNILALNLANDIVLGKISVVNARKEYSRSAQAFMSGNLTRYTQGLNFFNQRYTADPDRAFHDEHLIQAQESRK